MKKRILSILLTLIMVVCLVPTAAQAEEGDAEYTIESREGSSTTETVPRSGGGEYTEGVESVSQNGETLTAEMLSSTNAKGIASQTASVGSENELVAALADTTVDIVELNANISLGGGVTLTVAREVTLDLNGYVLKGSGRSVFEIKDGGHMIVTDSRPTEKHKFWVNNSYSYGVWNWDDQRGDTVRLLSANMQHTDVAVADVVISVVLGNDDTVAVTEFSPCRLFRRQRVDFVLQARVERLHRKAGFYPHRREDLNALARPVTPRSLLAQKVGNGAVIRGKQAEAVIPPQLLLPVQLREVHDILTQRRGIRALTVLLLQADRGDAERQKVGKDVSRPDGQQLIRVAEQGNAARAERSPMTTVRGFPITR